MVTAARGQRPQISARRWTPLAAVVAGLGTAAAFEPLAWWPLLIPSVALFAFAVFVSTPRRAALLGLLYGVTFMSALMPWLQVIGVDAWLVVSLGEGAFYAAWAAFAGALPRGRAWPWLCAGLWVGMELLRGQIPWGGLNWGRLAFAGIDTPAAELVTYLGFAGLSGALTLLALALAQLGATAHRRRSDWVTVGALLVVLGFAWVLPRFPGTDPGQANFESLQVAVIQGNAPGTGLNPFAERRVVLENHVSATIALAADVQAGRAPEPDLVVWPENSSDVDPYIDASVYADIQRAVDAIGVPVLVGVLVGGPAPDEVQNQGIVWLPDTGPDAAYSKMHPVPFGEFIPLRGLLERYIDRIALTPRDMVAGERPGVQAVAGTVIGQSICFEVSFDQISRNLVNGGAQLLVVQTSNATFMGTGQVDQQYAMTRLRALESGRFIAVGAVSGISAVIGPDGVPVATLPRASAGVINEAVPRLTARTPAMRWGAGLEYAMAGTALLLGAFSLVKARRRNRMKESTDAP